MEMFETITPGIKFCSTTVLRAGIIALGAKLSFVELLRLGAAGVCVATASVSTGLIAVPIMNKLFGNSVRLGALLAAGTSICGVTAITALAPVIGASEREIAVAVANVMAFGLAGMLAYPYIVHTALPSSEQRGMFLGVAIHDTSQVMGAAVAYSQLYGDDTVIATAALTKMTRNVFLAVALPLLAFQTSCSLGGSLGGLQTAAGSATSNITKFFPLFVLGFLGTTLVRTLGDIWIVPGADEASKARYGKWRDAVKFIGDDVSFICLGTAMAAIGLNTDLAVLRGVGVRPFAVGLGGALLVATSGYGAVLAVKAAGLLDSTATTSLTPTPTATPSSPPATSNLVAPTTSS
eukprot:gnl/Spiro4/8612_TR4512_c0_g1_i1.p1 gnl/Spiro4/8612_TR4512_c0_g1~~gnl/Spiro4/8612_TR4512_c0_g1_i1.p1  ORF type:complete len:350 (+),score=59.58 gnl/Spiro4/8612_TR4512_c0_g1_i1:531-1580(+)